MSARRRVNQHHQAKPVYPFTAIVGQDEMKLSLLLNLIDRAIGGVLIMGHRGTGKSTAVRALADLLPPMWKVLDCAFGCDPADTENFCSECEQRFVSKGRKLRRVRTSVPVVNLPLGATEDRVCGTLNIERALSEGVRAFEPGLLARAHRGFLYIDEVNLLEDHLIDVLLDASVTGRNVVEREGLSLEHPARFVLIGSGNPEEGELRPQLLDRFGLHAEIRTIEDLDQRVRIVERREAFTRDPEKFRAAVEKEQQALRRRIARAQKSLGRVTLPAKLLRRIAELCLRLKIDGHRGELTIARSAKARAAFEGRRTVNEEDVRRVAHLSLRHRLRRDPLEESGGSVRIERVLDEMFPSELNDISKSARDDGRDPEDSTSGRDGLSGKTEKLFEGEPANGTRQEKKADAPNKGRRHQQQQERANTSRLNDERRAFPASSDARLPDAALKEVAAQSAGGRGRSAAQNRNTRRDAAGDMRNVPIASRGRYAAAVKRRPQDARLALDATLRAAAQSAPRDRTLTGERTLLITTAELRFKQFKRRNGTLYIFAVDASGSMALNRIGQAKGALIELLKQSYVRRDRVALISFRGQRAETLMPPGRSVMRAKRLLDDLPVGGATPLCSALALSLDIARRAAAEGTERIVLLLFTDGRANVTLSEVEFAGSDARRVLIEWELTKLSGALRSANVSCVLADTQNRFTSNGEARALADRLGARYVYLSPFKTTDERLSVVAQNS